MSGKGKGKGLAIRLFLASGGKISGELELSLRLVLDRKLLGGTGTLSGSHRRALKAGEESSFGVRSFSSISRSSAKDSSSDLRSFSEATRPWSASPLILRASAVFRKLWRCCG